MSSLIEIICNYCQQKSLKPKKEISRKIRINNNNFFCDLVCSAKFANQHRSPEYKEKQREHFITYNQNNPSHNKDSFNYFKYLLRSCRHRKHKYNLSISDIENLWKKQNGKCAISGVSLKIKSKFKESLLPTTVSIDRINNAEGYEADNIQLIAVSLNLGKNNFSNELFCNFVKEIRESA